VHEVEHDLVAERLLHIGGGAALQAAQGVLLLPLGDRGLFPASMLSNVIVSPPRHLPLVSQASIRRRVEDVGESPLSDTALPRRGLRRAALLAAVLAGVLG